MVSTPQNEALNRRSQEHCSLTDKMSARTALRILSTIYPKSRFCTKRHKSLEFQSFSGISEPFTRRAEKGNCKNEAQICNSVFEVCFGTFHTHKPLCGDCLFFEYSDAIFKGRMLQCRGRGPWGHNQPRHYRGAQKSTPD